MNISASLLAPGGTGIGSGHADAKVRGAANRQSLHYASGVGIGLRATHYQAFLACRPPVDFLEVHTENVFDSGSADSRMLDRLCCHYPVSLHGVGLGIGSVDGGFQQHLERIAQVVERVAPVLISEHLCWGAVAGRHFNDLLPLPLTAEALSMVCDRVDQVQQRLGRRLLLENVSTFLRFQADRFSEIDFLSRVAQRTGCGILLDINNLYVNQCNHGEDALAALDRLSAQEVGELHLGGHLVTSDAVVDHHGDGVADPVWALYRNALRRLGPVATLIEWDTEIPALDVLLDEVRLARQYLRDLSESTSDFAGSLAAAIDFPPPRATVAVAELVSGRATVAATMASDEDAASLLALQQTVGRALVDGHEAAAALPLFARAPAQAAQRLALYRGNLIATWDKVLAAAYPVIQTLVGDAFFSGLARAYGKARPSTSGDLNVFGCRFADFLADFAPVAAYPYLSDMARLEWLLHRAHAAPAGKALDAATVASWTAEKIESARLALRLPASLFESEWAVVSVWQAHQENPVGALPAEMDKVERAIIVRLDWRTTVLPLSKASFAALSAINHGMPLGDALDAALEIDPDFDFAVELQRWLDYRVLAQAA